MITIDKTFEIVVEPKTKETKDILEKSANRRIIERMINDWLNKLIITNLDIGGFKVSVRGK